MSDFDWLEDFEPNDLKELEAILEAVRKEAALRHPETAVRISAWPYDAPEHNPIGSEELWLARRRDFANLFVTHRVFRSVTPSVSDMLLVAAELKDVREALAEVRRRLNAARVRPDTPNKEETELMPGRVLGVSEIHPEPANLTPPPTAALPAPEKLTLRWLLSGA